MNDTMYLKIASLLFLLTISSVMGIYGQEKIPIIDLRRGVHSEANSYRESRRLNRLIAKSGLNKLAQRHALDMAAGRVPFSHEGFQKRAKDAKAYFRRPISMAENCYMATYPSAQIAERCIKGWINSPGHHRNLKGNYTYTGIGVARSDNGTYYVVQLYAK